MNSLPDKNLKMLNDYQREAVENDDRAFLLNASVGSGKTTVLVSKVLYLYLKKNVPLSQMVVLTFTNKAADEIKDRILAAASDKADRGEMNFFGTFHSVARYLLSNILPLEKIGYTPEFTILDSEGLEELYENIIDDNKLDIKYKKRISKRLDSYREGQLLYGNMKYGDEIEKLNNILKEEKQKRNMMDFDDLIENCSLLLRNYCLNPSWVIIDEFQDTDDRQLQMIDGLMGEDTHIFAVGDPNQIIYTWRGSRKDIFDIFKNRYDATEKTLPVNYRSTGTILQAARAFLDNPRSLEGIRDRGNPIIVKKHYDAFNEALYLSGVIKKLHEEGIPYSEIAIFYRKLKHSQVFEDVFLREGIPYDVSVKKSIRDIPALWWLIRVLKGAVNSKDTESISYALQDKKYGLGISVQQAKKALRKKNDPEKIPKLLRKIYGFNGWCAEQFSTDDLDYKLYDFFDLNTYLSPTSIYFAEDKDIIVKYLKEIKKYIIENGYGVLEGVAAAVNSSALFGANFIDDDKNDNKDSVKLMTLHASKGLEFKYVFISGANYGIIPIGGRIDDEEEKRLFFVGITRARDYLEISYHSNPEDFGALPEPSPYLRMIPQELIQSDELGSRAHTLSELKREIKNNMASKNNNNEIKKRTVFHAKYGEGYIVSEDDDMITAVFEGYGEKSFSKLFCPLKLVE